MRTYTVFRNGEWKKILVRNEEIKKPKEYEPLGVERVIGVDTESLRSKDGLVTVLVPWADADGPHCQEKFLSPKDGDPILPILDMLMKRFGEKIQEKRKGKGKGSRHLAKHYHGHGTPEKLPVVCTVWYNLEYDLQRSFLPSSDFFRAMAAGTQGVTIQVGPYELQLVMTNPTGSAPCFNWICYDPKTRKALRIYGLDLWGYWKSGLAKTAKALGVGDKIAIEKQWFAIELEKYSKDMIDEMIRYAGHDAEITRMVYLATAELLGSISKSVFTRVGILPPSAPAAAARIAFGMMSGDTIPRPPKAYEQLALDAYHGGYVACIRRGWLENVTVADLHSAYPSMMRLLPDPCRAEYIPIEAGTWTDIPDDIREAGCLGFVSATFVLFPDRFPGVSKHHKEKTLHQPGVYERFAISLPELSALFDLGQIKMARIHSGFYVDGPRDSSFLRKFVDYFYEIKELEEREGRKDSPLYLVAKLLMNALYGKLIEIRIPTAPILPEYLYSIIYLHPEMSKIDNYREYAQTWIDGGEAAVMELSRRNFDVLQQAGKDPKEHWAYFPDMIPDRQPTAGNYFLPIYASLITSMTRAKIATMMNCFRAVGGDTDSIFTTMKPGTPEWLKAEKIASYISERAGVGPVKDDPGLGGYGIEMVDGRGYLAGLKQYFFTSKNPASPKTKKLAHHAIANAGPLTTRVAVARLARGQSKTYTTKPKPRRFRESLKKGDGQYGVFETEIRTVTPKEDERLKIKNHIPDQRHPIWEYEWRDLDDIESGN